MDKFIKIFVLSGFALALLSLTVSVFLHVFAGRIGDYYSMNEISIELIRTSRKCAGVTAFGGLMLRMSDTR